MAELRLNRNGGNMRGTYRWNRETNSLEDVTKPDSSKEWEGYNFEIKGYETVALIAQTEESAPVRPKRVIRQKLKELRTIAKEQQVDVSNGWEEDEAFTNYDWLIAHLDFLLERVDMFV
jgi:hypothetical protein